MRLVIGVCVIAGMLSSTVVHAASAKKKDVHQDLCEGGIVVKDKLIKHLARTTPGALEALALDPPKGHKESGLPLLRKVMSNPTMCTAANSCGDDADATIAAMRITFNSFLDAGVGDRTYAAANRNMTPSQYFRGGNEVNAIRCTAVADLVTVPSDEKDTSKLRVRGNVADLVIDRNMKAFKTASAAKVSYTDDRGDAGRKYMTKVQSVIGYAYKMEDTLDTTRQVIPYISVNQSILNRAGQRTLDESNYVAGGVVYNLTKIVGETWAQNFSASPQFLYNSTDRSQIANMRFIYTPYSYFKASNGNFPVQINTPTLLATPGSSFSLLFNLRSDIGYYSKKADPTQVSYARAGTQFGFAWSFDDIPITLKATETVLYGFSGARRNIDFFDASISYSLDPNDYFAITLNYQKGRDEDTTNATQTFTVGLTGKY